MFIINKNILPPKWHKGTSQASSITEGAKVQHQGPLSLDVGFRQQFFAFAIDFSGKSSSPIDELTQICYNNFICAINIIKINVFLKINLLREHIYQTTRIDTRDHHWSCSWAPCTQCRDASICTRSDQYVWLRQLIYN